MTQQYIFTTLFDGVTIVKAKVYVNPTSGEVELQYRQKDKGERLTAADRARGKRKAGIDMAIILTPEQAKALDIHI